jgi:hypothetical protein
MKGMSCVKRLALPLQLATGGYERGIGRATRVTGKGYNPPSALAAVRVQGRWTGRTPCEDSGWELAGGTGASPRRDAWLDGRAVAGQSAAGVRSGPGGDHRQRASGGQGDSAPSPRGRGHRRRRFGLLPRERKGPRGREPGDAGRVPRLDGVPGPHPDDHGGLADCHGWAGPVAQVSQASAWTQEAARLADERSPADDPMCPSPACWRSASTPREAQPLESSREGQIKAVLVYSLNRLSRKYAYQVLLIEELARYGVEVVFVRSP